MSATASDTLLGVFQQLTDPRDRRGVRHPFAGLLAVMFLGLLSRQSDFASIARWAKRHWPILRPAFGLTYPRGPHATTYGRAAALFSVDQFRTALAQWLSGVMKTAPVAAAVDGKTSKQADDTDGDPIHVLNVFAHGANVCLADWPVGDGKNTEPDVLWSAGRHELDVGRLGTRDQIGGQGMFGCERARNGFIKRFWPLWL
jgi:hypothetical protein